jgi:HAD superfamily hydrolase (TIGR01490 family)
LILALVDLDGTLLDGDSDLVWSELLHEHGAIDLARVRAFHADYERGELDIQAFLRVQLEPLAREPLARLQAWRTEFMGRVRPRIPPGARARLAHHAARGHELALITATNRFVCEPIARELGIANLIASEPEVLEGRFTGRFTGIPCFREGKLWRLEQWLASRGLSRADVAESWFYSDSHNDLPLLRAVTHPVAVDPDPRLSAHARRNGWPVLRLRAARHSDMPYSSPPSG